MTGKSSRSVQPATVSVVLQSLDFLYVPTWDVDAAAQGYVEKFGATLVWKVRAMGTTAAISDPPTPREAGLGWDRDD